MSDAASPWVGRDSLLNDLLDLVTRGQSVLLQGAAGVGKTRLVAEVCRHPGISHRPVDRLLGGAGGADLHLSTLAPLGLPKSISPHDITAVHGHFLQRWRQRGPTQTPALVWLDDVQHVDQLSADILRQAVVTGVVQLLGTHRTTDPLSAAMTALHTDALADLVEVPPLHRQAADELAQRMSRADLSRPVLDRVHALAAGNPLFIRELVRAVGEGDDLLSSGPLDLIVSRPVMALTPRCRHTLDLIALAEPLPERVLAGHLNELRELHRLGLVLRRGEAGLQVDYPLRRAWILSDLRPNRPSLKRELLDLVGSGGLRGEMDPVALIDWELEAGYSPDADRLEFATRVAIGRLDGPTSLRFAETVDGPERELLRGEALVISGEIDYGLSVLDEVRRTGAHGRQVEAAFWCAKYFGLVLGDYPRAEAVLDAVDSPELPPAARRLVLAGRLWLWIFGPISRPSTLAGATSILDAAPVDETAFDLATAAASLTYHSRGTEHAHHLMSRLRTMKDTLPINDASACREYTVRAWWHVACGSADQGVAAMRAGAALAQRSGSVENIALMAGSAGLLVAQTGRIREALHLSGTGAALPDNADWFQYERLAGLVHTGNLALAGRVDEVDRVPDTLGSADVLQPPDLYPLFLARARHLHEQALCRWPDDVFLRRTLELLARNRKHLWVALIGSELVSLSTDPSVHQVIWDSSREIDGPGLVSMTGRASRARLDRDLAGLLRAGQDLESAGMASAASRVMVDVATLAGGTSSEGLSARASLLRLRRAWDGGHMWWLDAVSDLPSTRQMEIAWRAIDGVSTGDIATDLFLSTRTVENHVYRVCHALHVAGRDELAHLLAPPRPSNSASPTA